MYGKNHYNIVISLQLMKTNEKKRKKKKNTPPKKKKKKIVPRSQIWV